MPSVARTKSGSGSTNSPTVVTYGGNAKAIARAGLASRREAEDWIAPGRVAVNGEVIHSPALNVTPRAGLVSQVMQHDADHCIADQQISRVGAVRSETAERLSKSQRCPIFAATDAISE